MKIGAIIITLLFLFSIGAAAQESKINQHLQPLLKDQEKLPVIIVMKDQPVITSRASAVYEMQTHAEKTQKALKDSVKKAGIESRDYCGA